MSIRLTAGDDGTIVCGAEDGKIWCWDLTEVRMSVNLRMNIVYNNWCESTVLDKADSLLPCYVL